MSGIFLFILVFAVSFVLTMIGLGGGLIFSPMFILLGFPINAAVTTSLFLNGTAAISAAIVYYQKRMVDFSVGIPLILSSMLLAPLGAYSTSRFNVKAFTAVLAAVIVMAALRMLFSKKIESPPSEISRAHRILGGGIIGAVIGYMGGLLGIGGGVFIVPLLIYVLKQPTKTAAATSMFIVIFSSFSGFVAHVQMTSPDWTFLVLMAAFSFAGGQLGARVMAEKLKGRAVRQLFGLVLLLFAAKLIQKAFF